MVPVCKIFGSFRLQIERGSGLLSSCPLQNSHIYNSANTRQRSSLQETKLIVKASNVDGTESSATASANTVSSLMKNQPDATVDINIAKALLDYINASWTPYHAVGAIYDNISTSSNGSCRSQCFNLGHTGWMFQPLH